MELIERLDLEDYINSLTSLFAREKELFIEGDINLHFKFIEELKKYDFTPPTQTKSLDRHFIHIQKLGVLRVDEIFEFIKIFRYFSYLKGFEFKSDLILNWLEKIELKSEIQTISNYFDERGNLKNEIDEDLHSIVVALNQIKSNIKEKFLRLLSSSKLQPYLVDRQIHLINEEEALLVRAGFNHFLKGSVIARSSGGFFYISPESVLSLKSKEAELKAKRDKIIHRICKEISSIFLKKSKYLKFLDREFERFDSYQARVYFAKAKDLDFILPSKSQEVKLNRFIHPAISNPKPVDVEFDKSILMVTGVNAGGKTMLLKSILSAIFLAKYLIPMKINIKNSKIGSFKEIIEIIDDPQSVKNDISTFAGRMVEFSKLFTKRDLIVGVDEIELGTDSDEAASLFKVILDELIRRNIKVVITTHHKRLASLMASNSEVELIAAIYDEKRQLPTYEFLQGTIGKSYAFETASRYGVPKHLVSKAKEVYGEDRERLNELIERSAKLELDLKSKRESLDGELLRVESLKDNLKEQEEKLNREFKTLKSELSREYQEAISTAKEAIRAKNSKDSHRLLNQADKKYKSVNAKGEVQREESKRKFKVGDSVKYRKTNGVILSLKSKEAQIEVDGIKLRVPLIDLKHTTIPKSKPKRANFSIEKPKKASVNLDLHGLRVEEALELVDKFISDSLLSGFDELLIYHGVGSGRLARATREFLKEHPSVVSYSDAPPSMGGFGATIVKL